jgi:hypothetical protein
LSQLAAAFTRYYPAGNSAVESYPPA